MGSKQFLNTQKALEDQHVNCSGVKTILKPTLRFAQGTHWCILACKTVVAVVLNWAGALRKKRTICFNLNLLANALALHQQKQKCRSMTSRG
jgi:hypothetical protein